MSEQTSTTKQDVVSEQAAADALLDARDAKATTKKVKARGRKKLQQLPRGRIYVKASYNNTVVTLTDPIGNTVAWSSAGACGFRGPKKATPYAAGIVIRDVIRKVTTIGLKDVDVFVCGIGSGRESAVRALHANGLNVLSINDVTPIPHNGCRPPKPRRI
ncbi:MAG: 30S ribosomal protein S11 [bacterium]|nr:30S ribosomal protein S11 [bacterium]